MLRCATLALVLLAACGGDEPAPAQPAPAPPAKLTLDDVLRLRGMGYDDARIKAEVARTRSAFRLAEADVSRLEQAGLSTPLIAHLKLTGVVDMAAAGEDPAAIISLVAASNVDVALDPGAVLDLLNKQVPRAAVFALKGVPLTMADARVLAGDGLSERAWSALVAHVGVQPVPLDDVAALALAESGVPTPIVVRFKKKEPAPAPPAVPQPEPEPATQPEPLEQPAPPPANADGDRAAHALGYGFPVSVIGYVEQSRLLAVQAVYRATALAKTGKGVHTGTVTQLTDDQFAYDPAPADRLVMKLDDATHEFVIRHAKGDHEKTSAKAWVDADHELVFHHRVAGVRDVLVTDIIERGRTTVAVKGRVVHDGRPYEVDLKAIGTYSFASDTAGYDYKKVYTTTGRVWDERAQMDVDEHRHYRIVVARRRGGRSRIATHADDQIRNRLRFGADTYTWDARFIHDTLDHRFSNRAGSPERAAQGGVLKNGEKWGQYAFSWKGGKIGAKWIGKAVIVFETPGESIVLKGIPK